MIRSDRIDIEPLAAQRRRGGLGQLDAMPLAEAAAQVVGGDWSLNIRTTCTWGW